MTDDRDEWGPWIEHDGRGCPVPVGTVVNVIWCSGEEDVHMVPQETAVLPDGLTSAWHWRYWGPLIEAHYEKIIRYRIRRPKALRDMIERIENLPAPERERADT